VTWLAWGAVHLIKPLGISARPSLVLGGRIDGGGPVHQSSSDTLTFTAERAGRVELASLAPGGGELQPDGSVATDRVPTARSAGICPRSSCGGHRASTRVRRSRTARPATRPPGLCGAEAARLADPPTPPPGWAHRPLAGREEVFATSPEGIAADCHQTGGIVQTPAQAADADAAAALVLAAPAGLASFWVGRAGGARQGTRADACTHEAGA
jgi:hypothetical protein